MFSAIAAVAAASCEKKYLRKVAVQAEAAPASEPKDAAGSVMAGREVLLAQASIVTGKKMHVGSLQALLKAIGHGETAQQVSDFNRGRRALAHPIDSQALTERVVLCLSAKVDDCEVAGALAGPTGSDDSGTETGQIELRDKCEGTRDVGVQSEDISLQDVGLQVEAEVKEPVVLVEAGTQTDDEQEEIDIFEKMYDVKAERETLFDGKIVEQEILGKNLAKGKKWKRRKKQQRRNLKWAGGFVAVLVAWLAILGRTTRTWTPTMMTPNTSSRPPAATSKMPGTDLENQDKKVTDQKAPGTTAEPLEAATKAAGSLDEDMLKAIEEVSAPGSAKIPATTRIPMTTAKPPTATTRALSTRATPPTARTEAPGTRARPPAATTKAEEVVEDELSRTAGTTTKPPTSATSASSTIAMPTTAMTEALCTSARSPAATTKAEEMVVDKLPFSKPQAAATKAPSTSAKPPTGVTVVPGTSARPTAVRAMADEVEEYDELVELMLVLSWAVCRFVQAQSVRLRGSFRLVQGRQGCGSPGLSVVPGPPPVCLASRAGSRHRVP